MKRINIYLDFQYPLYNNWNGARFNGKTCWLDDKYWPDSWQESSSLSIEMANAHDL